MTALLSRDWVGVFKQQETDVVTDFSLYSSSVDTHYLFEYNSAYKNMTSNTISLMEQYLIIWGVLYLLN